MVEQLTVNQLVPGSNPGRGALRQAQDFCALSFCYI